MDGLPQMEIIHFKCSCLNRKIDVTCWQIDESIQEIEEDFHLSSSLEVVMLLERMELLTFLKMFLLVFHEHLNGRRNFLVKKLFKK